MVLSDSKILKGLENGNITISGFDIKRLNPTSYDVTLHNKFKIYKDPILDCKGYNPVEEFTIPEEGFTLQPGEFYLYSTNEIIGSKVYSSEIKNKSSLARLGLIIHYVASWIDVGFVGNITLEMSVQKPLIIYPNMKIGQLIFHTIDGHVLESYDEKPGSKYMNQTGVQESLMHMNFPMHPYTCNRGGNNCEVHKGGEGVLDGNGVCPCGHYKDPKFKNENNTPKN